MSISLRQIASLLLLPALWASYDLLRSQDEAVDQPYFEARKQQSEYVGPGREEAEPKDLQEVRIGYFGPSDPAHPEGGDLWLAVSLAIDEANREGGYRGKPFRLIPVWADNPWGTGVNHVVRLAYYDKVWAIIGGLDGPTTHLAEQVVAKARLTLISPVSTDKTVNLANVPWMFSALPGDHLAAPVVGHALLERACEDSYVVLAATDHDSHMFLVELRKFLSRRGFRPRFEFEFKPGASDFSSLSERVLSANVKAVVLVAGPKDSARALKALRGSGFAGQVFGGPWLGRRVFLEAAGEAAEGTMFPLLFQPSKEFENFEEKFQKRFGPRPDYAAAQAYDSARLLVSAIRKAGLNRARIGDAMRELSPWEGIAGIIRWDSLGQNTRSAQLATVKAGHVVPLGSETEGVSLFIGTAN